jgi:hypothetical protein
MAAINTVILAPDSMKTYFFARSRM